MFIVIFPITSAPQLCGSEEFWEQAVQQRCNTVSAEVASLALEVGWRSIFFTSKLQLQKMISRRRLKAEEQQEGQVSDPDTRAEEQQEGQVSDPDTRAEESPNESSQTDQTSGSEEESHPGIIPDLSLGTGPGTGFETSSCCDVDPDYCTRSSRGDYRAEPDKTMS